MVDCYEYKIIYQKCILNRYFILILQFILIEHT
jgi:hypothetical protein